MFLCCQLKILNEFLISIYIKFTSVTASLPERKNHIEHLYVTVDDHVTYILYLSMQKVHSIQCH